MFWKDLLPLWQTRVNYRVFDWKRWKNTVKNNVLGFLIYMLELATGIGTWKN